MTSKFGSPYSHKTWWVWVNYFLCTDLYYPVHPSHSMSLSLQWVYLVHTSHSVSLSLQWVYLVHTSISVTLSLQWVYLAPLRTRWVWVYSEFTLSTPLTLWVWASRSFRDCTADSRLCFSFSHAACRDLRSTSLSNWLGGMCCFRNSNSDRDNISTPSWCSRFIRTCGRVIEVKGQGGEWCSTNQMPGKWKVKESPGQYNFTDSSLWLRTITQM